MTNYTTNYLSKGQFRKDKARLTRAVKGGDPQTIIEVVAETFAEWDRGNFAYPDCWHDWERARMDAEMALRWAS